MGVIDAVKEKLSIGQCHDPAHHHPETVRGSDVAPNSNKAGVTTPASGTTNTRTTTTTRAGHGKDCRDEKCAGCEDKWHREGKHVPWEDAQGKMGEAHEQARIAEINACKATKALESVSVAQREIESSQTRLTELERELEGMRGRGVDLSAKQAEVDAAKRRAADAHQRWLEAQRRAKEHEGLIGEKERRAAEAQGVLHRHHRGIQPLEQELADVQRAKAEAEQRYGHHHTKLSEFEKVHNPKEAELHRLQQEVDNHNRALKEAEAALAAVQMRHRDAHGKLQGVRGDYDTSLRQREELHNHSMSAKKYLDDLNAREVDLQRRLNERRGLLDQHQGAAATAANEVEAARTRAAEHRRGIDPLHAEVGHHSNAVREAEAGLGDAAARQRAQREQEAQLARELEAHKRTTTTHTTETQRRVQEYEQYKARADEANARKEELHDEARHLGDIGDRNADSHLRQLENRLQNVDISGIKNKGENTTTSRATRTVTREE